MRRAGGAGAWLAWWLGCLGLWAVLVGSWDGIDAVAGAVAAAVAGTVAESARTTARVRPRGPGAAIRCIPGILPAILADFGLLARALAVSLLHREPVRGRYVVRDFARGPHAPPAAAAQRAWTVLLAGYSPNAYVVDIDPDANTVLVHDLVPRRRSEEPV